MPKMGRKWTHDTGLLLALLFLYLAYRGFAWAMLLSALVLLALLFAPSVLTPIGYVWFTFAEMLARLMNVVFFALVFYLVVTPIGILRRLIGGDERCLSLRPDRESAFIHRSGWITPPQLEKPY